MNVIAKGSPSLKKMAVGLRQEIIKNLNQKGLSKTQVNLTSALLLGQKKELDPEIYNDFT